MSSSNTNGNTSYKGGKKSVIAMTHFVPPPITINRSGNTNSAVSNVPAQATSSMTNKNKKDSTGSSSNFQKKSVLRAEQFSPPK